MESSQKKICRLQHKKLGLVNPLTFQNKFPTLLFFVCGLLLVLAYASKISVDQVHVILLTYKVAEFLFSELPVVVESM